MTEPPCCPVAPKTVISFDMVEGFRGNVNVELMGLIISDLTRGSTRSLYQDGCCVSDHTITSILIDVKPQVARKFGNSAILSHRRSVIHLSCKHTSRI